MLASGAGGGLERTLRIARDEVRLHAASGEVAIVELDGRSLEALDQWPWPRRHHAALIDQLTVAGARSIAFDVNFSARSTAEDDRAMADALGRAGGIVILPTFLQVAGSGSSQVVEVMPLEAFRNNAFLAGVNVVPDPDGYVRAIPLGTRTAATARPSLASLVAEHEGAIDQMLPIDFSIDPASIPRFSYVDVMTGRVDAAALRGRRVVIGATAIDLGDRYAVLLHGVIPGVVIQALAAETLMADGVPGGMSGLWPLLLALGVAHAAVRPGRWRGRFMWYGGGAAGLLALPLATEHLWAITLPLAPALAALALAGAGSIGLHVADRFSQRVFTDADTGLPNLAALEAALAEPVAAGAMPPIVVVARIDRFATIASGLGGEATTRLVHRIVDRLLFDDARTLYRIDEASLAWCEPAEAAGDLGELLGGLHALMRAPIDCGRLIDVTIGFGVDDATRDDPKQQVANAALAAVHALKAAKPWSRFVADGSHETGWYLSLLGEIHQAMAVGEVWNAYQPKLDIASGRITGVETLVRWTHRERGFVGPDEFIPLLEEQGRIVDLTRHVIAGALADAARWRDRGQPMSVAINVSAMLLGDEAFIGWVREQIRQSAVPPADITIEVTESAAMRDAAQAAAALAEWRLLGVGISIDDYGTGQSSLGYLQTLPATELKIDKSFVRDIVKDARSEIMVSSTIALAHQLGLKVVAEGVEDQPCLDRLAKLGCDTAQGWLIARPMRREELERFLGEPQALAA